MKCSKAKNIILIIIILILLLIFGILTYMLINKAYEPVINSVDEPNTSDVQEQPEEDEIIADSRIIKYDLINQDQLPSNLVISEVYLSKSEAIIRGPSSLVEQVQELIVIIDITSNDVSNLGKYTLDNIPLLAYDSKGNTINNIEIIPESVNVEIEVTEISSKIFRNVPISIINLPENCSVTSLSQNTIDIIATGNAQNLANLTQNDITVFADLTNYSPGIKTIEVQANSSLPDINLSINPSIIKVNIINKH